MTEPDPALEGAPVRSPRRPTPGGVLLLLLGVAFLYVVGGAPLQYLFGEAGLALTQLFLLLGPALWFVIRGGYDPVATLALRRPRPRQVAGGLLLLAGATPVAWILAWAQSFVIEVPTEMLETMAAMFQTTDPFRILWLVVLVAVLPALCEEVLFRGVVLSGLRTRLGRWSAVGLTGLLFGVFHLTPYTAFRFLPTAWLGLVLTWVVWETRSLWMGVLLHFVNNGTILLLSLLPATQAMASDTEQEPPLVLLPLALLLLVAGARLLAPESPDSRRTPAPAG